MTTLEKIQSLVGNESAERLRRHFAGCVICIPKRSQRDDILTMLGPHQSQAIHAEFAGCRIYFPKNWLRTDVRHYLSDNPDARAIEVVARFGISRSTFYDIKRRLR